MKLNRTTQRTVEILKLVSKNPEGITLDEICGKLDLPKTSAYDIVTTLAEMGMVNVDRGQRQRYTIGLTAYRIGINYTNNLNFISVIEPEMRAFAKEVGKTVFFGVRSDHEVVYICKTEPENPIITTATVGTKNPMYCTSLGKAILAYSDEETCGQIMSRMKFRADHYRQRVPEKRTGAGEGAGICPGSERSRGTHGVCGSPCFRTGRKRCGSLKCVQSLQADRGL